MKKVFFKIIIPNYNNFKYIKKCLDSILEQSFTDWHCIIVDDLSTDKSDRIAQIYSKRYPDKFTFLKLDIKGHEGGARNKGIDYPIDCEYYYFIDSDDWLYNKFCLQKLYDSVIDRPDILIFRILELSQNGNTRLIPQAKFNWDSSNIVYQYNSASTKIVSSKKIQYFLENCDHAADAYQTYKVLDTSPTIKQIDDVIYVYNRQQNSLTLGEKYKNDKKIFYDNLRKLLPQLQNEYVKKYVTKRIDDEG